MANIYCVEDELWIKWDIQKSPHRNKAWLKKSYLDGEELIHDAQRFLRQIPESRLIHELEKLKEHCIRVIAESGEYIT